MTTFAQALTALEQARASSTPAITRPFDLHSRGVR